MALYQQVLRLFLDHQANDGERMRAFIAAGEWAEAERLAHTTKSVAGSIGHHHLADASRDLESLLRMRAPEPKLRRPLNAFAREHDRAIQAIGRALSDLNAQTPGAAAPLPGDVYACQRQLDALIDLLRAHDGGALDLLEAQGELLSRCIESSTYNLLRKSLSAFDFDGAVQEFCRVRAQAIMTSIGSVSQHAIICDGKDNSYFNVDVPVLFHCQAVSYGEPGSPSTWYSEACRLLMSAPEGRKLLEES